MKRAEKVRKTVTRISAGVIFACLLTMTLQINFQGNNSNSPLSLKTLTFGLVQPAAADMGRGSVTCYSTYNDCWLWNCSTIMSVDHAHMQKLTDGVTQVLVLFKKANP